MNLTSWISRHLISKRVNKWHTKDDYKYLDELWLIVGKPDTCKTQYNDSHKILENPIVIAKGIEQFFERMIQANGDYYFDLPDFVPDDTIDSMR